MYRKSARKTDPVVSQNDDTNTMIVPLCCYTTEMTIPQAIKTILAIDFTLLLVEFVLVFLAFKYVGFGGIDKILVFCGLGAYICQLIFVVLSLMAGGQTESLRSRTSMYRHVRFLIILFKILILCLLICRLGI